jgi:hypothetical protein
VHFSSDLYKDFFLFVFAFLQFAYTMGRYFCFYLLFLFSASVVWCLTLISECSQLLLLQIFLLLLHFYSLSFGMTYYYFFSLKARYFDSGNRIWVNMSSV